MSSNLPVSSLGACRAATSRSSLCLRTKQLRDGVCGDGSKTIAPPKGGDGILQKQAEVVGMGREKKRVYEIPLITLSSSIRI